MIKMRIFVCILLIALFSTLTACGGSNLSGTWADRAPTIPRSISNYFTGAELSDYYKQVKFSGSNFILTQYTYSVQDVSGGTASLTTGPYHLLSRIIDGDRDGEITELGEYLSDDGTLEIIDFHRIVTRGKYSIKDDRIEFLYPDGHIEIYTFEHTENTLTLDSGRFGDASGRYIKQ